MENGNSDKRRAAFHAIVGRALTDREFRESLQSSGTRQEAVAAALQGTGVEYGEIEEDLAAAVNAVGDLAELFDPEFRAAS